MISSFDEPAEVTELRAERDAAKRELVSWQIQSVSMAKYAEVRADRDAAQRRAEETAAENVDYQVRLSAVEAQRDAAIAAREQHERRLDAANAELEGIKAANARLIVELGELEAARAELRALKETCSCSGMPQPEFDVACPQHGALRAADEANRELYRIRSGVEAVCERIEANGRGTPLEIVTNGFCAEFRAVLSGGDTDGD